MSYPLEVPVNEDLIHFVNNSQVSILHSRVYDKHTQSTGTGAKSKRRERLFYASVQISMMQVSLKILWTKNKYTLNKTPRKSISPGFGKVTVLTLITT